MALCCSPVDGDFYPRSPCGERQAAPKIPLISGAFLSTLSLRRATAGQLQQRSAQYISIHALLAESDLLRLPVQVSTPDFYPRSPCGERLVL